MKLFTLAGLLLCTINVQAQLITYTNTPPHLAISNGFLGSNYTISNVTYTGEYDAFGQFDATGTNIGFEKGILLTTGTVLDVPEGPHGPNDNIGSYLDNSAPGDADLDVELSGLQSYNAAVLEFDFIPAVDSLSIPYIFGSEEYPEYVGSSYSDILRIYISGPGIPGLQNLAILPNSSPVSILTVNAGSNPSNFVNNGDGNTAPYNGSPNYIQYDGYTRDLEAKITGLQVGELYHLKIAIADVSDGILDSGVFLESCSTCNYAVGLEESEADLFLVQPNPTNGLLTVTRKNAEISQLSIRDINGREVSSLELTAKETTLNLSEYRSGIYFVTLISDHQKVTKRIVVQQ